MRAVENQDVFYKVGRWNQLTLRDQLFRLCKDSIDPQGLHHSINALFFAGDRKICVNRLRKVAAPSQIYSIRTRFDQVFLERLVKPANVFDLDLSVGNVRFEIEDRHLRPHVHNDLSARSGFEFDHAGFIEIPTFRNP